MTARTEVLGGDRFAATMGQAAEDLEDLAGVNREAAARVLAGASARVPVVTGGLASSLGVEASAKDGLMTASVPYAGVIEFGWPLRNIAPAGFAVPALEEAEGDIEDLYAKDLERILGKVKGA